MNKSVVLATLRANESRLREMGLTSLSIFGSTARGEEGPTSDVDLAATFDRSKKVGIFKYAAISGALEDLLGVPVDLVGEPARKPRMQQEIDRDRLHVF
jgi:uncharacterized protein